MKGLSKTFSGALLATTMFVAPSAYAEEANASHSASNSYSTSYNSAASQQKLSKQEMCDEIGFRQAVCDGLKHKTIATEYDIYQMGQVADNNGVGIFINLARNTPDWGDKWGNKFKTGFNAHGIDADYRFAQSNGTATEFTFYVRDVEQITVTLDELAPTIAKVMQLHQGALIDENMSNDEIEMNRTLDR